MESVIIALFFIMLVIAFIVCKLLPDPEEPKEWILWER